MADYQIIVRDSAGGYLTNIQDHLKLDYTLVVNGIGVALLTLPPHLKPFFFNEDGIIRDQRLEINRTVGQNAAYLEDDAVWFVRRGVLPGDESDPFLITAYHCNSLLATRIVAYDAGSAEAEKTGLTPEAMLKEIVDENFVSPTDTARSLSFYITVEGDSGIGGTTLDKAFARRNVFDVLREIADFSYASGRFLAFALTSTSPSLLTFRTFYDQRGFDRRRTRGSRINPVVMGPAYGNLQDVEIEYDSSDEFTFVYTGGLGEEGARVVGEAEDTARVALSVFGRRELFVDTRVTDDQNTLDDEAEALLKQNRPRYIVTGKIAQNDESLYGLHYKFGDRLTFQVGAQEFDVRLNGLQVSVEGGKESIQAVLRSDE